MKRFLVVVLWSTLLLEGFPPASISARAQTRRKPPSARLSEPRRTAGALAAISAAVEAAISEHKCPGAVVLVGHQGRVIYRKAFGRRTLVPRPLPMTVTTIFDLASLTKVVATTTAVMQLVEQGKIRLEDPVTQYWPEFGANGKEQITVRELMTHYSGLRGDLDLKPEWSGYDTAMRKIEAEGPIVPPGTRFIYSDINYETLGELVRRTSGQALDRYSAQHIFKPLGMRETIFNPPARLRLRIAPTQYRHGTTDELLWGQVNDPTAYDMGGVAGHAGLFSTAGDLAIFAQMVLNGGSYRGARILSSVSVSKMTTPQTPVGKTDVRGLGWDIDSPYASSRGELFPLGSFGHTGFTGTSLWIDPFSKTYVIILTSALHPKGEGSVVALRSKIANIVAAAYARMPTAEELAERQVITSHSELMNSYRVAPARNDNVETGIDVLEAQNFAPLAGLRVGLLTNQTGLDSTGRRTVDLLAHAPGIELKAIFSPEHGFSGNVDQAVPSTKDSATGLPVYSLYGETERPTDKMLERLNALVYDVQDAGVRFYTYETTLGYALEAAAKRGIRVFVLDRPVPISGIYVEGPVLDRNLTSFVGYFPMPVRHGMTIGELAGMFNAENRIGADLQVVKMKGWNRPDWYDETSLTWVNPSPNLRSLTGATLYPGVGMVEGANLSVGRGTDAPFAVLGAPWIDAKKLAAYLNGRHIQGVRFSPVDFTPRESKFARQVCHGIQLHLIDRQALDAPELGVELAVALYRLFPNEFEVDKILPLLGSRSALEAIKKGRDPRRLSYEWQQTGLAEFRKMRAKYLLY